MMTPRQPEQRSDDAIAPVGAVFIGLYTAAQIGVFIAFIPFLSLLLPLKAEAIDPLGKALLLGQVALWGAMAAALSNVVVGVVSDRMIQRLRGRSPWIILGLAMTVASYGAIHRAETAAALITAVILLQISINLMLNPLSATLPERVPNRQKGMVAAFVGLAFPVSSLFGAVVLGVMLKTEAERIIALLGVIVVLVVPFFIYKSLRPNTARLQRKAVRTLPSFSAMRDRDFLIAFGSRLLVQTTITLNVLYLLFYLQQETRIAVSFPNVRPELVMGGLLAVSTGVSVLSGLLGGYASDRMGRRKLFVMVGGLLLAAAALLMAVWPMWPGPVVAQILFGLGVGLYGIVDAALIAEVIPSQETAGQDLGLMNVAVTAAQVLAPVIGLVALSIFKGDLRIVFALSALLAGLGGVWILAIRRVP